AFGASTKNRSSLEASLGFAAITGTPRIENGAVPTISTMGLVPQCGDNQLAKRLAERLGKGYRPPVERLHSWRSHVTDGDGAFRSVPKGDSNHQTGEQQRGAARVPDAERAVGEVGHCGAEGGGSDDGRPVQERVEFFGRDLRNHQRDEKPQEEQGSDEI